MNLSRQIAPTERTRRILQAISRGVVRGISSVWHMACARALRTGATGMPQALNVRQRVGLGEKRFVAVLEFDGERFLVGGGANSVAMLARLNPHQNRAESFADMLKSLDAEQMSIQ